MKSKDWQQILKLIGLISQVGLLVVTSIGIGFVIGYFLDRILGFSFFLTPIFIFLGVAAGFWSVYQMLKHLFSNSKKDE